MGSSIPNSAGLVKVQEVVAEREEHFGKENFLENITILYKTFLQVDLYFRQI
jgi:hypothetical protein